MRLTSKSSLLFLIPFSLHLPFTTPLPLPSSLHPLYRRQYGSPEEPSRSSSSTPVTSDFTFRFDKDYVPTTVDSSELSNAYSPTTEYVDEFDQVYEPTTDYIYEDSTSYEPGTEYSYEDSKYYEPTAEYVYEEVDEYAPTNEYSVEFVDMFAPTYEVVYESSDSDGGGSSGISGGGGGGRKSKGSESRDDPVNYNENNNLNNFDISIGSDDHRPHKSHTTTTTAAPARHEPERVTRLQEDTPHTAHPNIPEIRVQRLQGGLHSISSIIRFSPPAEMQKMCTLRIDDPETGGGRIEVFEIADEDASTGRMDRFTWKKRPKRGRKVGCWDSDEEKWSAGNGVVRCGATLEMVWAGEDGGGALWMLEDVEMVEIED